MQRAILVVDIQYDFLPGGALAVAEGNSILGYVADLIRHSPDYRVVVATRDWHPPDHGSFASNNKDCQPFAMGSLDGIQQIFWPDHCVQGSRGAQLEESIQRALKSAEEAGKTVTAVRKGMDPQVDSYSAFFDNARRHETELRDILSAEKVEAVDIVGLAFDFCVKFTALDSASLGFATRVLLQGTRAVDPQSIAETRRQLQAAGVECVE